MPFVRNFFASMLALFVFFIIVPITLLSAFAGIFVLVVGYSINNAFQDLPKDGVLVVNLQQPIIERPYNADSILAIFERGNAPISTFEASDSLFRARDNPNISAVLLRGGISQSGASIAQVAELRTVIAEIASKKEVVAYLENPTWADYYLASAATYVVMNPMSDFDFKGMSAKSPFFGEAMRKYGVDVQVVKTGEHKGFGDIFTESKMAEGEKQILLSVINSIWGSVVGMVGHSRSIEFPKLVEFIQTRGVVGAKEAKEFGFVDELMYEDELITYLGDKYGFENDSFKTVALPKFIRNSIKSNVAIVYMSGDIVEDSPSSNFCSASEYVPLLRSLRFDDKIQAVILRIDSGGGSAYASELIRREVELLAAEKPVYASFGAVAASGAYWIATAANKIYADDQTITGSIGVFSIFFSGKKLANDYGIDFDGVKTDPFADMSTLTRPKTQEEIKIIDGIIMQVYDRFVKLVSQSRKIPEEDVRKIADGRIFSGIQAHAAGYVDEISPLYIVVSKIREENQISFSGVEELPIKDPFAELMRKIEKRETPFAEIFPKGVFDYYKAVETAAKFSDKRGIYTRIPFDIVWEK